MDKAAPEPRLPTFTTEACMFDLPIGVVEGQNVLCGYLTVPEEHSIPDGPIIQLAVVIIKNRGTDPKPDPLFMAQGGPGGSTIDTYAEHLLTRSRLLKDRDIVLFDQRGTLYSDPDLFCEEYDRFILDTLEKDLPREESEQLEVEAVRACRQRLEEEHINLSAYDSLENAADINTLREALGYEQINLYGVSYGTLLALHTMRQHPEMLRSVILDAVVPPQTNFILESAHTIDRSFTRLFLACENDSHCNQSYPDLEKAFYDLVEMLDNTPASVPMTDPDSGITYQVVVDGEMFLSGLFLMLYATDLIPALPRMIYDARDGKFDFFSRIMELLLFDRTTSYGMYYTVMCAEDADFNPTDQDLNGVHPQIAEVERRMPAFFLELCRVWDVEPISPEIDQPVASEIPTLVLSGGFDPITPPAYGQAAADTLPNSFSYTFPAGGHGQAMEGPCQDSIILDFLDDPSSPPDGSCIQKINKPTFITRFNTLVIPNLITLLNLEENTGYESLVLFTCLSFLLTTVLVFPLAWAIRRLKSKTRRPAPSIHSISPEPQHSALDAPLLIKMAPWMATMVGPILLTFLSGLFIVAVEMVLKEDSRLFFGLTPLARGWFVLPILVALLSIGMLSAGLLAWARRHWKPWMRLYYTLLTLSAQICTMILLKWGFVTALIKNL